MPALTPPGGGVNAQDEERNLTNKFSAGSNCPGQPTDGGGAKKALLILGVMCVKSSNECA
jgi:hypothetical protein